MFDGHPQVCKLDFGSRWGFSDPTFEKQPITDPTVKKKPDPKLWLLVGLILSHIYAINHTLLHTGLSMQSLNLHSSRIAIADQAKGGLVGSQLLRIDSSQTVHKTAIDREKDEDRQKDKQKNGTKNK